MKTKIKEDIFICSFNHNAFFNAVYLNAKESMLEDRTIGDIVEKYQENPFRFNVAVFDGYEIEPKAEAPYVAGKLKTST